MIVFTPEWSDAERVKEDARVKEFNRGYLAYPELHLDLYGYEYAGIPPSFTCTACGRRQRAQLQVSCRVHTVYFKETSPRGVGEAPLGVACNALCAQTLFERWCASMHLPFRKPAPSEVGLNGR